MAYSLWLMVGRVRLRTISLSRLCGAQSAPYEFYDLYPVTSNLFRLKVGGS